MLFLAIGYGQIIVLLLVLVLGCLVLPLVRAVIRYLNRH